MNLFFFALVYYYGKPVKRQPGVREQSYRSNGTS
uniref:Uncharacterized protein n=1 Tax=Utricularia reniformis TaxID=192314 RepID=A0A1Y0B062_9LAMI|nr:hypothetical protein AEK19_MT0534 [Utricularia reniformis]ART30790.1 hypothetical protein AEK19_MT0534 [Utricularia reniformis]